MALVSLQDVSLPPRVLELAQQSFSATSEIAKLESACITDVVIQ